MSRFARLVAVVATIALVLLPASSGYGGSSSEVITEVSEMSVGSGSDPEVEPQTVSVRPLSEVMPDAAARLAERYARRWLAEAKLPEARLREAVDTAGLAVAHDSLSGTLTLRQTSSYTGSTYELADWDGSEESALRFIDECAELQGLNVEDEREMFGPTPWDRPK